MGNLSIFRAPAKDRNGRRKLLNVLPPSIGGLGAWLEDKSMGKPVELMCRSMNFDQ